MTTAVFTRAGSLADEIRAEARNLDPVRVLLTVLMVVPFVLGWLAGQAARAVWVVGSFVWVSAVVGWRVARRSAGEGSR